ncbi:hypothetical protein JZ751_010532 [Albula glossodonta]|uniref:Globin domain-containing protein n=1 Tax=Albula glossodonta TaxID=121402 RepID=A0A8T2NV59_9TELE|nr:hypothetical protein JZ751_010532 [Albula glossodonta]
MGCAMSGLGLVAKPAGDMKDEDVVVANLSQEQTEMIKESWKVIQEDIAKVGIIMFVRLFETHPECKDVFFLFRDVEDLERLRTSKELRAHGLRAAAVKGEEQAFKKALKLIKEVMSFIEKTVARLDQLERLDQLALDLGKAHYRYNAPPKYYSYVGVEFIRAVQPILKEKWTAELEEAWKDLFLYVTRIMKKGYLLEERDQHSNTIEPSKEKPDKKNTRL